MENNEKALVVVDPFQIMDRLDDELIIQELEGRLPDVLTYHFEDKGKEIWGLSKAGVDECKTELAKKGEVIRELEVDWDDKEREAFFRVKVARYVIDKEGKEILLDTAMGFKRQPKHYATNDKFDPFWYEKGGIKACRNACMRLIPKTIQEAVIEYAKKGGKVKTIKDTKKEKDLKPIFISGEEKEAFKSKVYDYINSLGLNFNTEVLFTKFYTFLVKGMKVATKEGITKEASDHVLSEIEPLFNGFRKSKYWKEIE